MSKNEFIKRVPESLQTQLGLQRFKISLNKCINKTQAKKAKILAEKLRKTIEELKLPDVPQFTCSFGVAQMEEEDFTHDIIKRADDALYEAKNSGRNIVIAKGESR